MCKQTIADLENITVNEFYPNLDSKERNALFSYTYCSFQSLNKNLRNGIVDDRALLIDKALDKYYYDKEFKIYRKIMFRNHFREFLRSIDKGYIIDRGFCSTSLSMLGFDIYHNAILDIKVNNPSCGAYIAPYAVIKDEYEFLLKRDTRLDIEDYKINDDGIYLVKAIIK